MAALSVKDLKSGGAVNPAFAAASGGGDTVANPSGNVCVHVRNGGGGSINVTCAAGQTSRPGDGVFPPMTLSSLVTAVPAGEERIIGPLPSAYNDGNGNVALTYSGVTSVTVAAYRYS